MPGRYQELVVGLLARCVRFSASHDPETGGFDPELLPEAQVLGEVMELIDLCDDFESDLAARAAAAWIFRSLDQIRSDDQDWITAAELYRAAYETDRDQVPPTIQEQLQRMDQAGPANLWGSLGGSFLRSASRTSDGTLLTAGIRLTRRALDSGVQGAPRRADLVHNLVQALASHIERARTRADLRDTLAEVPGSIGLIPASGQAAPLLFLLGSALFIAGTRLADVPALRDAAQLALAAMEEEAAPASKIPVLAVGVISGAAALRAALAGPAEAVPSGPGPEGDSLDFREADASAVRRLLAIALMGESRTDAGTSERVARAAAAAGYIHWHRFLALREQNGAAEPMDALTIVSIPRQDEETTEFFLSLPEDPAAQQEVNLAFPLYALIPPGYQHLVPGDLHHICALLRDSSDNMAVLAADRAANLLNSYAASGDPADAANARDKLTRALTSPYLSPGRREWLRIRLSDALVTCYQADSDAEWLSTAVAVLTEVKDADLAPGDQARALIILAAAYAAPYGNPRYLAGLNTLRAHARQAPLTGSARLRQAYHLLAEALSVRFDATRDFSALQEIVGYDRAALQLATADEAEQLDLVFNTGIDLIRLFGWDHDTKTLREGVGYLEHAYRLAGPDAKESARFLGAYLQHSVTLAEETGDAGPLAGLIATAQAVLSAARLPAADAAELQDSVAMALHHQWVRDGAEPERIDEILDLARKAAAVPAPPAHRARRLGNLGYVLLDTHIIRDDTGMIEEGIAALRESAALEPPTARDRSATELNLASLLHRRAETTGDQASLEEAVACLRQAALHSVGTSHQSVVLRTLGGVLVRQGRGARDVELVREGIGYIQQSLELSSGDNHEHDRRLMALSDSLFALYGLTGDLSQLSEAVSVGEEAVRLVRATPFRPGHLAALARIYWARFKAAGAGDDVSRAEELLAEAIRLAPLNSATHADCLGVAGNIYLEAAERTDNRAGFAAALRAYRLAASIRNAPARDRAGYAWHCGRAAARLGDTAMAAGAFALVVQLLDEVAWHGLRGADQERFIEAFFGAGRTAGAWALERGDPPWAVELLESGRTVMLSRSLAARTPLDELSEAAPDLATRFAHVQIQLDRPTAALTDDMTNDRRLEPENDRRVRLARERDDLLGLIREIPGFDSFLRPQPFSRLREAAANGPVVIVNTSPLRCDALIVTADGVEPVRLTGLTTDELADRVESFVAATAVTGGTAANSDLSLALARRQVMLDTLAWLWDTVTEPIFKAVGITAGADPRPRLWWCPTGYLSFLPLHAAGRYGQRQGDGSVSALDYVVSSYTPNLRALTRCAAAPGSAKGATEALLVAVSGDEQGSQTLPQVEQDVAAFLERFPGGRVLRDREATADAVLTAVATAEVVHFACHAKQNPADPSSGGIRAYDRAVTIRELRDRITARGELAMLMGCETAVGGTSLPDEAITLAAALQLIGYSHAAATLWPVNDADAATVAAAVYRWIGPGATPPTGTGDATARAIHAAVQETRRQFPFAPGRWAPFIHVGP